MFSTMNLTMENMPVCKLNFDEDFDYSGYRSVSPHKSSGDVDMEMADSHSSYAASRNPIKQLNGRLFSPRKPIRSYGSNNSIENGCSESITSYSSSTSNNKSFKGYNVSPTNSVSPPDKKVRALRLFDSPNTPKTLMQKASQCTPNDTPRYSRLHSTSRPSIRSRLFAANRGRSTSSQNSQTVFGDNNSFNAITECGEQDDAGNNTAKSSDINNDRKLLKEKDGDAKNMRANVNPFTPTNIMLSSRKRSRKNKKMNMSNSSKDDSFAPLNNNDDPHNKNNSGTEDNFQHEAMEQDNSVSASSVLSPSSSSSDEQDYDDDGDEDSDPEDELGQPCKRIAIHEVNVSRYHKEFVELSVIGRGVFGSVFLCRHRLDGCLYAIKRSLKPVAGSSNERTALNEVYAHAVLGAHQHVVRYYSAWAEDDHMIIQNEYCNGGSLAQTIENNRRQGRRYTEEQIKTILLHLAKGLKFIHSLYMVHLDVKPDNIFITCELSKHNAPNEDSADDGFEEGVSDDAHTEFTYKIGDLGHVTSVMKPKVEEGDCRYLPRELLQDDYSTLPKVDIFALGLTLFEAASGSKLPLNGTEWQNIRNGELPDIAGFSRCFQDLLKLMIHNDPKMRPSASQLINHEVFNVSTSGNGVGSIRSRGQLRRELVAARLKNEVLEKQLQQARYFLKQLSPGVSLSPASGGLSEGRDSAASLTCGGGAVGDTAVAATPRPASNDHLYSSNDSSLFSTAALATAGLDCQSLFSPSFRVSVGMESTSDVTARLAGGAFGDFPSIVCDSTTCDGIANHDSDVNSCSGNVASLQQSSVRQYHYNTRSQQQQYHQQQQRLNEGSLHQQQQRLHHNRFIGKRTVRSQSVL